MLKSFFFGNYFYALCAVLLSVETVIKLHLTIPIIYYIVLFCAVIFYYNKAYILQTNNAVVNERNMWYAQHYKAIITTQITCVTVIIFLGLLLLPNVIAGLLNSSFSQIVFLINPIVVGLMYYGFNSKTSLRYTHWLKPFVIAFVWASAVSFYPLFYYQLSQAISLQITMAAAAHFINNFLFVAVLCIMFDIKDYATDYNQQLQTFVVSFGLRKTIYFIIIPFIIIACTYSLIFIESHHFSWLNMILTIALYCCLMLIAISLQKRKSILYYLIIIDGMMIVKAFVGIMISLMN